MGVDATQNNSRWSIPAPDVSQNDAIARVWKDFVAYHASPAFFDECVRVFGDHVVRLYPHVFPSIDALRAARLGIRDRDPLDECDFFLDAQISGNTPVQRGELGEIDSRRLRTQTVLPVCCTCARPTTIRSAATSTCFDCAAT